MLFGLRTLGIFFAFATVSSLATGDKKQKIAAAADCEISLQTNAMGVLQLARTALENPKGPRHQKQIALQSLVQLQNQFHGAAPEVVAVIRGEVMDLLFDHFTSVCTFDEVPWMSEFVAEISGARLSKLLDLYQRVMENPDDSSIASSPLERFQVRLALDRLLWEVGKARHWIGLDPDRHVSDEASLWFVKFYDLRKHPMQNAGPPHWVIDFHGDPFDKILRVHAATPDPTEKMLPFLLDDTVGENFFALYPKVSSALYDLDHQVENLVQQNVGRIFHRENASMPFELFAKESVRAWKRILGILDDFESEHQAPIESWNDRSLYFLAMGAGLVRESAERLSLHLEWEIQAEFRNSWRNHPYFAFSAQHSELPFGKWSWIWQIAPGDQQDRQILKSVDVEVIPLIRSILAFKHLAMRLSRSWERGSPSDKELFYLSEQDLQFFLRDPAYRLPGLAATLEKASVGLPIQSFFKDLEKEEN
jgi:hypothetical protein